MGQQLSAIKAYNLTKQEETRRTKNLAREAREARKTLEKTITSFAINLLF